MSRITYSFVNCGRSIHFVINSANLLCRGMDILRYFRESFGLRDNECRLYVEIVSASLQKVVCSKKKKIMLFVGQMISL